MEAAHLHAPLRIFLFKREYFDVFHLRRAIGTSLPRCFVNVLEQDEGGLRTARAVVRSGKHVPGMVLFELLRREPRAVEALHAIRELPELKRLPVVILGNGEDAQSTLHAFRDGAAGFIPLPERASELPRVGRDVARFWRRCQLSMSA